MVITIRNLDSSKFHIEANIETSILECKHLIKLVKNIQNTAFITLIFQGKILSDDSRTLQSYQISESSIIICNLSSTPRSTPRVFESSINAFPHNSDSEPDQCHDPDRSMPCLMDVEQASLHSLLSLIKKQPMNTNNNHIQTSSSSGSSSSSSSLFNDNHQNINHNLEVVPWCRGCDGCHLCGYGAVRKFGDSFYKTPVFKENKPTCQNLDMKRRKHAHIAAGRSNIHGWGAFLINSHQKKNTEQNPSNIQYNGVRKHELVCEYTGEFISQNEADRRGKIYDKLKCSFLFNLNELAVVDATRKGSKAKYVNHEENANCYPRVKMVSGDHRIGIYAGRDLVPGEEISFNYSASYWTAGAAESQGSEHVV
mmetsp:Transcript_21241/g.27612  ORF Transcript_21241/g.27612 Transcript_21241/m.27612 type:complete len:368 (+) Transcript_21241:213-1316(+)